MIWKCLRRERRDHPFRADALACETLECRRTKLFQVVVANAVERYENDGWFKIFDARLRRCNESEAQYKPPDCECFSSHKPYALGMRTIPAYYIAAVLLQTIIPGETN